MKKPSINLSGLRDTKRLKAWLRAGRTVELCERGRIIVRIVPLTKGDIPVQKPVPNDSGTR